MDTATANRLRALVQQDVNWDYLVELGHRNLIIPLLYSNLNETCPEAVPALVMEKLRGEYHHNGQHNLLVTRELLRLLKLFQDEDVYAIPFKGPLLAAFVYGHLSLRWFSDLDLLISASDSAKAANLLLENGYRFREQITADQEASLRKKRRSLTVVRDDGEVTVDLQWGAGQQKHFYAPIFSKVSLDNTARLPFGGMMVPTLPASDLLLYLCIHGSKHCWERVTWICDVAEVIRANPELDWGSLVEQAKTQGSYRMLILGLTLVRDLLGSHIPPEMERQIRADRGSAQLAEVVRETFYSCSPMHGVERDYFHIKMMERLSDKLRYTLDLSRKATQPNERDLAIIPLPKFLSFMYRGLRPFRLMAAYGPSAVKLLGSRSKTTRSQSPNVNEKSVKDRPTSASKSL